MLKTNVFSFFDVVRQSNFFLLTSNKKSNRILIMFLVHAYQNKKSNISDIFINLLLLNYIGVITDNKFQLSCFSDANDGSSDGRLQR